MRITTASTAPKNAHLMLSIFEGEKPDTRLAALLSRKDRTVVQNALAHQKIKGGEAYALFLPDRKTHLVLLGKGPKRSWNTHQSHILVRRIVQESKARKLNAIAFPLETAASADTETPGTLAERIGTELTIADFSFTEYKETPKGGWPEIQRVTVVINLPSKERQALEKHITRGIIIGEEVNHTRRTANTPGGDMTPEKLAREAREIAKRVGISCTVLDEPAMKKLGMGGLLGVARGSSEKPQFIILEHKPKDVSGAPLVLVGKGVTFDTGGLNLKPSQYIYEMHMDMSGGAAVIFALAAIARLKIPLHVIGLIPAAENMPSGSSYHPGDILRSITGKTIEVLNTDAEGRVILADALGYAARYKPRLVVDIATLTGAASVALGLRYSGLFTNEIKLEQMFRDLGELSGDRLWPLPIDDDYLEDIRGTFGDVANIGKPDAYGGAITGAMFLKQFVSYPWAHIDMAPTMTTIESDKLAKGAKGTGVRLFVALAEHLVNKKEI